MTSKDKFPAFMCSPTGSDFSKRYFTTSWPSTHTGLRPPHPTGLSSGPSKQLGFASSSIDGPHRRVRAPLGRFEGRIDLRQRHHWSNAMIAGTRFNRETSRMVN